MDFKFERKAIRSGSSVALIIPKEICDNFKIEPGTPMNFIVNDKEIRLEKGE